MRCQATTRSVDKESSGEDSQRSEFASETFKLGLQSNFGSQKFWGLKALRPRPGSSVEQDEHFGYIPHRSAAVEKRVKANEDVRNRFAKVLTIGQKLCVCFLLLQSLTVFTVWQCLNSLTHGQNGRELRVKLRDLALNLALTAQFEQF